MEVPARKWGVIAVTHWNTGSHMISEVKQYWAWSVPRWVMLVNTKCCKSGCESSPMANGSVWEFGEPSLISSHLCYLHLYVNMLGRGMNSPFLLLAMGSRTFIRLFPPKNSYNPKDMFWLKITYKRISCKKKKKPQISR